MRVQTIHSPGGPQAEGRCRHNYQWCREITTILLLLAAGSPAVGQPPLVVETDPLPPAEQRKLFHLPPGFEIQLVASEPDIGQPMNLNFDAAGRLWVTHSVEYPYPVAGEGVEPRDERFGPAGEGPPRDRLSVLSDIGRDGNAASIRHVVEGLNIPIGQTPVPGGMIFYSIPKLWVTHFQQTAAGDTPVAPAGQVLFGSFGNVDTHGMVNSLTRWIDGWVYACHGFRNTSIVRGSDRHEITLESGNTFRFREDGSRIEHYTWGQVNPFGLAFDALGNIFTADCHSMPVTCLIQGAFYSSFGKPHDGLGFGPDMIDHNHGSTGICGVAVYEAPQFPQEYQGHLFICNPVTGRVHRDRLRWYDSSPMVESQPDFITCDDGWFRPVDVQLGPDGALYIADFYNSIIGHYEVPLDHPLRDRTHGRIWRIVWRGLPDGKRSPGTAAEDATHPEMPQLTQATLEQLVERLGDRNLIVRTLATNELHDRFGASAIESLLALLRGRSSPEQRVGALWMLSRLRTPDPEDVARLAGDESRLVRTHLARALGEQSDWTLETIALMQSLLRDDDPFVRRSAAAAFGQHPGDAHVSALLGVLPPPDSRDTHLRHTLRIALRNRLLLSAAFDELAAMEPSPYALHELASVCLGVPSDASARFLSTYLQAANIPAEELAAAVTHIGRHGSPDTIEAAARFLREQSGDDWVRQFRLIEALRLGIPPQQQEAAGQLREWATSVARELLARVPSQQRRWTALPAVGVSGPQLAWPVRSQPREGQGEGHFFGGRPDGEQGVGVLRSDPFALPAKVTFWLSGHDGFPTAPPIGANRVLLRDAHTEDVLAEAAVPRQDNAIRVTWEFPQRAGQEVLLEIVDGLSAPAYAWIAAGEFSLESLNPAADLPAPMARQLIEDFHIDALDGELARLATDESIALSDRIDLWKAQLALRPEPQLEALLSLMGETTLDSSLRSAIAEQFADRDAGETSALMKRCLQAATEARQQQLAEALSGSRDGAERLLELVSSGTASAHLLSVPTIQQKLAAVNVDHWQDRVAELTAGLPPENERLTTVIRERRGNVELTLASADRGKALFAKHCAACHQIAGEGKRIGPQLDGIGIRGVDRLLEDLLDPNRNVDAAFRTTTVLLDDGRVITGLLRSEDADVLVLADTKGEELRVPVEHIETRQPSTLSLMPENLVETLKQADLNDLLAFLLAQSTFPAAP